MLFVGDDDGDGVTTVDDNADRGAVDGLTMETVAVTPTNGTVVVVVVATLVVLVTVTLLVTLIFAAALLVVAAGARLLSLDDNDCDDVLDDVTTADGVVATTGAATADDATDTRLGDLLIVAVVMVGDVISSTANGSGPSSKLISSLS